MTLRSSLFELEKELLENLTVISFDNLMVMVFEHLDNYLQNVK